MKEPPLSRTLLLRLQPELLWVGSESPRCSVSLIDVHLSSLSCRIQDL